ncbi:hypothetical protein RB653_008800 [Dictyostelium firmibasis]|uniref:Uncharacterized protein n=1 Tax=Dictyostelium firmibasis TaxID=79012 RepID=A0AAN7YRY4_9MYCE
MSTNKIIGHSKIVMIDEIINESKEFSLRERSSIRTIGILKLIDLDNNLALLEYKQTYLYCTIDQFISHLPSKINKYYQIIGELEKPNLKQQKEIEKRENQGNKINKDWILNSRVHRLIDGIDIDLYKESLIVRRKFENQHGSFN